MKTPAALLALLLCPFVPAQGNILAVAWTGGSSLIDSATGVGTPLGASGALNLNSLAYHPVSGLFYTVSGGPAATNAAAVYTVNPVTGAATNTGIPLGVSDIRGLAITPAGICYAIVNAVPDQLYTLNLATGAATLVGSTGSGNLQALASNSSGALFGWAVTTTTAAVGGLMSINPATGAATAIGSSAASIQGLAFSPSGVLYGCNTTLYTINTTTGATTAVGPATLGDVRGIEFTNQLPPSVSFLPANGHVSPGGVLTVLYSAPGHAGETFVPVPSCTLGSFYTPPLPQPLGIAWDACTDFYFNDPNGLAWMPLSGLPGSFASTLDGAGTSTGFVLPPAYFPPGLNITVHVTFVSWNAAFVVTVYGVGTFLLN